MTQGDDLLRHGCGQRGRALQGRHNPLRIELRSLRIGPVQGRDHGLLDLRAAETVRGFGLTVEIAAVGATVTIFCEIFQEKEIVPTPTEATVMMLGLYEDTGSLQFTSTTERDYLAAAFLLRHGADLSVVADNLVQEMTADQIELLHALIQSRQVLNINGIDISIAHASCPDFISDVASLAHKIKDMESLEAIILVIRMGERLILVGRSRRSEVLQHRPERRRPDRSHHRRVG